MTAIRALAREMVPFRKNATVAIKISTLENWRTISWAMI